MSVNAAGSLQVVGGATARSGSVLTPAALDFVLMLHRRFEPTRRALLRARADRQRALDGGAQPDFLADTVEVREGDWRISPVPATLERRYVEITGPVEPKMMINALNSGANIFMVDFEDATSPTWRNVVEGQANCIDAVRRTLEFTSPDGKHYRLADEIATLVARPRGWHLDETHVRADGADGPQPVSASLFDFGLYFFHNAHALIERGLGPYFYLPKLESHLEARLWNEVFDAAEDALSVPRGGIRATVLIETILAAFEMDEILYELRTHAAGLNAGRWDYIFSAIKKFRARRDVMLPDRAQITMTVPFMRAYTELLVRTCHRRGAHAIGGMAAFVPSRRDAEVNEVALNKVREDKIRESGDGFDGTWVAHPDLVPVAREVFTAALGARPHQKERLREEVVVSAGQLVDVRVPGGTISREGVRLNVDVALQYLEAWLRGNGAVAIHNLMEDTATAEISRAQLWQWVHHRATLVDGARVTAELYATVRDRELNSLRGSAAEGSRYDDAARLLDALVLSDTFAEFLTIAGMSYLTHPTAEDA